MGMITRVRGRLRSFHTITKGDKKLQDEKISQTVCLLSVVLLLPYCYRGQMPLIFQLGGVWLITYTCIVVPILVSANYMYPIKWIKYIKNNIPGLMTKMSGPITTVILQLYSPIDRCERVFMKMLNLSNMATQLVFFMMCDRVLLCSIGGYDCPKKRVTGLYSLMFYNVIAYCVSYIKELIDKEDWSPYVHMTQHSNLKHVAMSATKIVLEWTKAITFIITVTFMLLVFGLEQGLEYYQPNTFYTIVTWSYYMCTEKVFVQFFPTMLLYLRLHFLEALETFYAPVLLRYYTITLASFLSMVLLLYGQFKFTFIASYLTVYLNIKDMIINCLKQLKEEQAVLGKFRNASFEEIENCDDVCAVCLCAMKRARVTPCQHLFHADCLRQCLNSSYNCPICKREYIFT
ncbi:hypothetical protein PPYR_01477 [Photinus pyralis]|uniref:RING-type domain-containing protein n=1 Tax=Photinus pyralis TaxID=7054 RepID=A0A1Y1LUH8_PHOPY|nr:ERAD-associated E3 ubiquitin-protein ligase HRD1B-like [Photinus pyralis]KAB0804507.1 hypothetical protein PPYR_01477 [Photinus pyralis]